MIPQFPQSLKQVLLDSYAGWLDESTTWHDLVDRGKAGDRLPGDWPIYKNGGLLLFHIEGEEAQRRCFRGTDRQRHIYYQEQVAELRAGTYSRLHLNKRTSGEGRFVSPEAWEATADAHCQPVQRLDRRPLWIGVDAGTKRDAAALVACTYNRERDVVELVHVREWKPGLLDHLKLTGGMDLDATIGAEIRWLDDNAGPIREVRYDPWQMAALAQSLEKAGIAMQEMPQTAQRTEADQALYDAITSRTLRTFDNPKLTAAVRKAAGKETPRGFRLTKRSGDDLVVALSMAHFGASEGQGGGGGSGTYLKPGSMGRVVINDRDNGRPEGQEKLENYLDNWRREQARRKPKQTGLRRRR